MDHAVSLLLEVTGGLVGVRILLGWCRWRPWRPVGDPRLVEVMRHNPPHRPGAVCCALIDETSPDHVVRQAFARCDPATRFEIGSLTKTFTGLLLADAFDRGELGPTTTLAQVWPDMATTPAGSVTMDELAHHTSGLPNNPVGPLRLLRLLAAAYLGWDPDGDLSDGALRRLATGAHLNGRGKFHYSNLGAPLTGMAITHRAGAPDFSSLLETRLLHPLELDHASARPDEPRPAGHGFLGAWAKPWRSHGYAPAGGMTSTLDDMTRYARLLLADQVPGQHALPDTLFWQCVTTPEGLHRYWHNGQTGGYSCCLAIYPDTHRAVIVLAAHANAKKQAHLANACVHTLLQTQTPSR